MTEKEFLEVLNGLENFDPTWLALM